MVCAILMRLMAVIALEDETQVRPRKRYFQHSNNIDLRCVTATDMSRIRYRK
jgi:hypothetical protein